MEETKDATSEIVIKLMTEDEIPKFVPQKIVMFYNVTCFTAKNLRHFMYDYSTTCKNFQ